MAPPLAAAIAPRLPGRRLLLGLLAILVAAVVPVVVLLVRRPPDPVLDDLGTVGPFALTDERGQPFTDDALRGHVTIVSFLFTRCDSICPITTAKMAKIQDKTFDAGASIKLASFSIDPTYDTPARLTDYATKYGADAARWRFVTGPADKVRALVEGPLMTAIEPKGVTAGGAPAILHRGYFLLIDAHAKIRGIYESEDLPRLDTMIRDARYLVRTGQ